MDTEFIIMLFIVGTTAIFAMIIFNLWQEYKFRRNFKKQLLKESSSQDLDDSITPDEHYSDEPHFNFSDNLASSNTYISMQANETSLIEKAFTIGQMHESPFAVNVSPNPILEAPTLQTVETLINEPIDEEIFIPEILGSQLDMIVYLTCYSPILNEQFQAILSKFKALDNPVICLGKVSAQDWEPITQFKNYSKLLFSLQIVNSEGSFTEETLTKFKFYVDEIAEYVMDKAYVANYNLSDSAVMERAKQLKVFCEEVDHNLKFYILSIGGRFTGIKLKNLMVEKKFQLSAEGSFVYLDAENNVLFTIKNLETATFNDDSLFNLLLKGLVVQLTIPTTKNCTQVVQNLFDMAGQLSVSLNARLTDISERELSNVSIEKTIQFVQKIEDRMLAEKIPAGSCFAKRLFQ